MTKRTVLLLALAATAGVPALTACSSGESQAPLPPSADGSVLGAPPVNASAGSSVIGGTTADGRSIPTSGSVGANVTPAPSGTAGGLTTRPGYVPGGLTTAPADTYVTGARAPWGILLGDRPAPVPEIPATANNPARQGSKPGQGGDLAPVGRDGGVAVLAGDQGGVAALGLPPGLGGTPPGLGGTPPGHASEAGAVSPDGASADTVVPSTVSFASLLSVLPPAVTPSATAEGSGTTTSATTADPTADVPSGEPRTKPDVPGVIATPGGTPAPSASMQSASPLPAATTTAVPSVAPNGLPTGHPTGHPAAPALPVASGWRIDGLRIATASSAATGDGGSAAFKKALRFSRNTRPDGARPGAGALRQWSDALQRAASLAPDATTRSHLATLSRYVDELAATAPGRRNALQSQRPGALSAATDLRQTLPRRFGVRVL